MYICFNACKVLFPWQNEVVDNLKHTDIVICFSAISRLHEPPPSAVEEPKKPHTAGKRGDKPDLEKDTTNMTDLTIDGMLKKGRGEV